jgi:triosephosphate isomerase
VEVLNAGGKFAENAEVVVAPTALHLGAVQSKLRPDIQVAVQNVWEKPSAGAWTGELTVDLIKDFGINWAIIGHSERRAYCGETPEKVGCVTCYMLLVMCVSSHRCSCCCVHRF